MKAATALTEISICLVAEGDAAAFFAAIGAIDAASDGLSRRLVLYDCGLDVWGAAALAAYVDADTKVVFRSVPNGDKAAAFNDYVHRATGSAFAHVFVEGAAAPAPRAFRALVDALAAHPRAWGATGLPASGHRWKDRARKTILEGGLSPQLFAASPAFLAALRQRDIRLPYGASGIAGIVAFLMATDLRGGMDGARDDRIVVADDALFTCRALGLRRGDGARWLVRERERAKAAIEAQALFARLKERGAGAMPLTISELWRDGDSRKVEPRRDPVGGYFDRRALRRIKALARS